MRASHDSRLLMMFRIIGEILRNNHARSISVVAGAFLHRDSAVCIQLIGILQVDVKATLRWSEHAIFWTILKVGITINRLCAFMSQAVKCRRRNMTTWPPVLRSVDLFLKRWHGQELQNNSSHQPNV